MLYYFFAAFTSANKNMSFSRWTLSIIQVKGCVNVFLNNKKKSIEALPEPTKTQELIISQHKIV